ncbi:hypothetical protein PVAND_012594 [Polypedilum vanderplanki]|uniref:Odorant receptor n=1 Tax=Polypedilum vanderplanki TaxID=319348 RepID=A0A9J6CNU5_POLVA|nr:hypothetical protein PVAND_012594 [Polypedilum vanderplanki]
MNNEIKIENLLTFSRTIWKFLMFEYEFEERQIYGYKLSSILKIMSKIFFIFVIFDEIFYTLINSNYLFELYETHEFNFEKLTSAFTYLSALTMVLTRYSCIYFNKDSIRKILNNLPKEYKKSTLQSYKIDKFLMNFLKLIKFHRYFNSSVIPFMMISIIAELLTTGQKSFPFEIKFPFDAFRHDVYPFLIIWVFFSHILYLLTLLTNENFIYGLITVISIEFKLLAINLKNLKEDPENIYHCIKRQNELYKIVEKLQKILAPSFFINFLLSSILLCFTAFISSIANDFMTLITEILFCFVGMLQICIQCFFGQILYDTSSSLVDSIYDCGWENMNDVKLKKLIMIIIIRSQKPAAFSLLGIWKITLEQFQSVS